jgi:hypothetical protein
VSRIPACSPASTRLQNRASKYWGYLRKAEARLEPVSTSDLMSNSSLAKAGLLVPLPTMSKDCSSGTPDLTMVANWREKSVMSLSETLPLELVFRFFSLEMVMPWRRREALAADSLAALISPRTTLPALFLPSQEKSDSFGASFLVALPAVAIGCSCLNFWFWPLCLTPKNRRQPPLKLHTGHSTP